MRRAGILALPLLVFALARCVGDDPDPATTTNDGGPGGGNDSGGQPGNDGGNNGNDGSTSNDSGSDAKVDAGPPMPEGKIDWSTTFAADTGGVRVATDASGNVYAAIGFSGTVSFGGALVSTGKDIAVVKMTSTGTVTWAHPLSSAGTDSPLAISVDGSDVYVAGTFAGATMNAGNGQTANGSSGRDSGFVTKLSAANGDAAWVKAFVPSSSSVLGMSLRARGGKVAFDCDFTGGLAHPAGNETSTNRAVLVGFLDPTSGAVSNSQLLKGTNAANVYGYGGVDILKDGSLVVAGRTAAQQIATRNGTAITNSSAAASRAGFVLKLTSGLNASWIRIFGSSNSGGGGSVLAMEANDAGNIYAAGPFETANFGSAEVGSVGLDDVFVAKLDGSSSGTTLWSKTFGGTAAETMAALAIDPWDQPIVTGVSTGGGMVDNKPLPTGSGIYLVKLASGNGAPQYVTGRTSGGSVFLGGLAAAPNGYAIVGGNFTGALDLKTSVDATSSSDAFVAGFTP